MFSQFLISIVVAPVVIGVLVAKGRRARLHLPHLLALFAAFDVLYMLLLYYLRYRWVG